ncbi:hypothetical protein [Microtetraspora malaysiensis]|uniref:Uncharacterized protein n=1 Tax=Microtetraspora malaysiensis TaxID=161358 RepID=A0ABW6SWQ8_9ACTN
MARTLPVVMEERYSQVFKLEHVRPAVVAKGQPSCRRPFPVC